VSLYPTHFLVLFLLLEQEQQISSKMGPKQQEFILLISHALLQAEAGLRCMFVVRPRLKRTMLFSWRIPGQKHSEPSHTGTFKDSLCIPPHRSHHSKPPLPRPTWVRQGNTVFLWRAGEGVKVCWTIIQTITHNKLNVWLVATWEKFWSCE
jgi:hypothetical protein